jgi:hypothetical protein
VFGDKNKSVQFSSRKRPKLRPMWEDNIKMKLSGIVCEGLNWRSR